ncbi:MAG: permease [Candidatus Synechococcus spongiarum 142]|uniref:Permease n=1 Tax=Candidatus Synechococcus spongiarum 142 TaxID=1608213 RepID=A0A6N3X489_9SYNE|nr:MAG: permease [Candidatus Synechococcus spongiarum 142]
MALQNILTPPVLFFFLGVLAVLLGSDLEIPAPLPKLFSLYLLLAIGFTGGVQLERSGLSLNVLLSVGAAVLMASVVPLYSFLILRTRLDVYNSAAIAAAYGSTSAVTYITAESFLRVLELPYDGFMVAALALMESPAIIVGLLLVRLLGRSSQKKPGQQKVGLGAVLHEAFLNSSVFLLIGSLLVGFLVAQQGPTGVQKLEFFTDKLFYGVLTFFLLDMGLVAARRLNELRRAGPFLMGFAVLMPLINAALAIGLAAVLGMSQGTALLFTVLCASSSYIAVPAAMRMTVPEANPSLYISTGLGLTFPFNIIVGIPVYLQVIKTVIPAN